LIFRDLALFAMGFLALFSVIRARR